MATFNNGESGLSVRTKINNVLQHADGTASELVINDAGADVNFRVESNTNPNALFVDGGTGNVGIRTASAGGYDGNANLTVFNAAGAAVVNLESTGGSSSLRFYRGGIYNWNLSAGVGSTDNLTFRQGATERMRIDPSGNVGIGTSSPAATLDVNAGSASEYFRGAGNSGAARYLVISASTTTNAGDTHTLNASSASGVLRFATAGAERMRIDSSGNVGIGTSAPQMPLTVNGVVQAINSTGVTLANGATGTLLTPPRGYSYVNISTVAGTTYGLLLLVFRETLATTIISTVNDRTSGLYSVSVSGTALQVTNASGISSTYFGSCVNIGYGTGN